MSKVYMDVTDNIYEAVTLSVHSQLKERINASIYVTIRDDNLYVTITKFETVWKYMHRDILNDVLYGTTAAVVETIVKTFKRDLNRAYFY